MKNYFIIPLLILHLCPTICFSQNKVELEIIELLESEVFADQYKAIELMEHIDEPSEKLIYAVFNSLAAPPFFSYTTFSSGNLLVKWGVYTTPFLIETLKDTSNTMYHRTPKLLLEIAQQHDAELIAPAISGLVDYIKQNNNEKKYAALWALTELGASANDVVQFLTEEMINSKNTDIFWSFSIAEGLEKIAGSEYLPIQSLLAKKKEYEKQDTTFVNRERFKLKVGFDISRINFKEDKMRHSLLVSPSQFYPYRIIKFKNIIYDIAIKNSNIMYISTSDKNFITQDSLMIGDSVKKVRILGYNNFIEMSGWGHIIKLKAGWYAGFCEGKSCTNIELNENSKIDWFFKN